MPAVSKKQQRFFGYLLSNPEERKKKGISKKAAKDFAQDVKEVAPPGWGHTKAEKEKTKPDKPKSKIGGTAAAFKRALDDGRFKGLPGSKTKKEKTADMFKLMWSMKKKGDKPHYKPGTDKKYKKYQEEEKQITPMQDKYLFGNAYAGTKPPKKKKKIKEDSSYSRVFHHITIEDVKRTKREQIVLEKLKEFKEEEIIEPVKHVDWRYELEESDWTDTTVGNKVASTFTHVGGDTFTHSAIGGIIPSTVEVGGEDVPAPTADQYGVTGFTPLMQQEMQRKQSEKKADEINKQLDSSEDYTKRIDADALMKARVADTEYFEQEHEGHDMSHGYSLPPKFLDDWATKTNFYGDMRTLWDGKTRTWKLGGRRVDNQGRTVSLKDIKQRQKDAESAALLDRLARSMGVGTAKNVFDYHVNFIKNPTNKPQDVTNLVSSKDMKALEAFARRYDNIDFDNPLDIHQANGGLALAAQSTRGLQTSLGKLDLPRGDGITKVTPEYIEIRKAYDFDGLFDIGGSDIVSGVPAAIYAMTQGVFGRTPTMYTTIRIPRPKKKEEKVSESLDEASFRDYMAQAQVARDRVKQKHDNRKKKDAAYIDRVKQGVKFYDKKGSGRLVKGKKVYD